MSEALRRRLLIFTLFGAGVVLPIMWLAYRPVSALFDVIGYQIGRDFINMWSGPQIVARFGVMTLFDLPAYQQAQSALLGAPVLPHTWSYPLHALFFAWPFALLPYLWSLLLWTLLGLALYLGVAAMALERQQRAWGALFLVLAPASIVNIAGGQNGFYTAALLLGGLALIERRPWIAGILFGALTVKPHLGLMVPVVLIALGAWRSIVAAVITAVLLIAAAGAVWGTDAWLAFLTDTMAFHYGNLLRTDGYTYMMVSVLTSLRITGVPTQIAEILQLLVSLAVIAVVAITIGRTRDIGVRALIVTSGTLLASPQAFNYDMPMLSMALLWVMASRTDLTERDYWVFGAAWIMPGGVWYLHLMHVGAGSLILGAVFATAILLARRDPRKQSCSVGAMRTA